MFEVRKAKERGHVDHGWLNTFHTFSFASYHDPEFMGFRSLRVINEDWLQPATGFGTHSHHDMEIITYVVEGQLEHKDSMGNGSIIEPGDVQYMSAGSGVTHSEFNHSKSEQVHLLQIWILPDKKAVKPRYDQKPFAREIKHGTLCPLVSADGSNGTIAIHQNAKVYASILSPAQQIDVSLAEGRYGWLQVVRGKFKINQIELEAGDGLAVSEEKRFPIQAVGEEGEFLFFDLN